LSTQEYAAEQVHKDAIGTKVGMWLFLFSELILFGGLFLMYSVYRFTHQNDFHIAAKNMNIFIGTMNTLILLTSSMTIALSITAMQRGSKKLSIFLQLVTVAFGLLFLLNKYFEWSHEIFEGNYPGSPSLIIKSHGQVLFFGLYYVMTGLHALHVIVGAVIICVMMRYSIKGIINKDDNVRLEAAGLYWHLVDIIWIFLFPLFYLIT
jgi:cytochrome c oxidase subunit III